MAQKKDTYSIKKYNPETDIVPLSPTTFSIGRNNGENESIYLEFAFDNEYKKQRISLGNFSIPNKMAHGLIDILTKTLNELEEKKNNEK